MICWQMFRLAYNAQILYFAVKSSKFLVFQEDRNMK